MTILVTGFAGFIGSHLTERLLADRFDVVGVDDWRSSPLSAPALKAEVGGLWDRLEWWDESLQKYYAKHHYEDITAIYHLAAPVGPAGILPYRGQIVSEMVETTSLVIQLAKLYQCRLVYVSSSEIYGGGVEGLCREDMVCQVPLHRPSARLEYAIGKMAGEIQVINTRDLDSVIVRFFNVAGPRQSRKGGFVLPTFVQQALAGEKLTVFGDGKQVRAFTHVLDVVDGLILAMREGKSGQTYNLGNPDNKTTIEQLAFRVLELADTPGQNALHYMDGREVYGSDYREANDKFPDAIKAMTELGWKPTRSIEETIQDVVTYERSKRNVG